MKKKNPPDRTPATAAAVADWMLKELEKQDGVLHQEDAASQIADLFGERFTYESEETGNACIDKQVLAAFRRLTGDEVVWIRGEKVWRQRELGDEPGRKQE